MIPHTKQRHTVGNPSLKRQAIPNLPACNRKEAKGPLYDHHRLIEIEAGLGSSDVTPPLYKLVVIRIFEKSHHGLDKQTPEQGVPFLVMSLCCS